MTGIKQLDLCVYFFLTERQKLPPDHSNSMFIFDFAHSIKKMQLIVFVRAKV
jgi:hypothetical protein